MHILFLNQLSESINEKRFDLILFSDSEISYNIVEVRNRNERKIYYHIQIEPLQTANGIQIYPEDQRKEIKKLKLKLTVEQLGILFRILHESDMVFDQVSKNELTTFLSSVFSTGRSPNISIQKLEQVLKPGYDLKSKQTVSVLNNLLDLIKGELAAS